VTVRRRWILFVGVLAFGQALPLAAARASSDTGTIRRPEVRVVDGHRVGLGHVLSTSDGGQIFGWDIDEHGADGVLSASRDVKRGDRVSMQTFDQVTGEITETFATSSGPKNSYGVDGIFAGDIALVTHYVVPHGSIYAKRFYDVMDPVTDRSFTGSWTSPVKNFDVIQNGDNQSTTASVLYGIELNHQSAPALIVSDLASGTGRLIPLNRETYRLGTTVMAQDTATNRGVLASSDGAVLGPPPLNSLVNLSNGRITTWEGLNLGPYGAGFVNGLAVDSGTGIACTTTELNAQVEFYDLATKTGTAVQLPGTGDADQLNSGTEVTSDAKHKLFLVADPVYRPTGGGAIVVYDEKGNLVEAIPGFHFSPTPGRIAVNPKTRTGWADGPGVDQLQQFFY
jgi:hypothetical protein